MSRGSGLQPRDLPEEVIGYTPEEKLRRQQLRELRRRWLKDQELSPREPVLPPRKLGFVEAFWQRFLQPEKLWKRQLLSESLAADKLVTQLLSESGFPIDFACQKVAKGDHGILGRSNGHKYEPVAKHLNFDHMIMGMLQRT